MADIPAAVGCAAGFPDSVAVVVPRSQATVEAK